MQTWSGPNAGGNSQSVGKLATYTLVFFSLAGLIAGFAFGGFLHTSKSPTSNTGQTIVTTPSTQIVSNVTPTATTQPVIPLDVPKFKSFPPAAESAENNTTYSFTMQVVDKQKQPVSAPDITCKVWLVQQIPNGQTLSIDSNTLKNVNNLTNAITGTINNQPAPEITGLTFDPTTPQSGFCNANGQMTWKYSISTALPHGTYDIVILADWKGIHWNWSWANVTIQ